VRALVLVAVLASCSVARPQIDPNFNYDLAKAARELDFSKVKSLLDSGVDPNSTMASDLGGGKVIMWAASMASKEQPPERVKNLNRLIFMLLDAGASPAEGHPVSGGPFKHLLHSAAANLNEELLAYQLNLNPPDIWSRTSSGNRLSTPLMNAIGVGTGESIPNYTRDDRHYARRVRVVTMLCGAGADPLLTNDLGTSIINYVSFFGYFELLRPMLEKDGAGRASYTSLKTHSCPEGYNALHSACLRDTADNAECVRILLAAGANVREKDAKGRTAHQIAREKGHARILEALGPEPSP
jgi:ankyrin repeat protein